MINVEAETSKSLVRFAAQDLDERFTVYFTSQ